MIIHRAWTRWFFLAAATLALVVMGVSSDSREAKAGTYTMSITNITNYPNATYYQVTISTNTPGGQKYYLYSCGQPRAICDTQPLTNAAYWNTGTCSGSPCQRSGPTSLVAQNLQENQTYYMTYAAVDVNDATNTDEKEDLVSTWPMPMIAPVDLDTGCNGGCGRVITWNTSFPADTGVSYSLSAPNWVPETVPSGSFSLSHVSSLSDGTALAVGQNGQIMKRSPDTSAQAGTWQAVSPGPSTLLTGADLYSDSTAWVVGLQTGGQGRAAVTVNGGGTWIAISGIPGVNLSSIVSPDGINAWASGSDSAIVKISGTTASLMHGLVVGDNLGTVYTHDNRTILAGGPSGRIYRSTDGGTTWSALTLGGAGTDSVQSLASIDGQIIWAGASSGKFWKSTDAGATWSVSPILSGTGESVSDINLISSNSFYFRSGNRLGYYNAAGSPQFTFDGQPAVVLGSALSSVSLLRSSQPLVVGSTVSAAVFTLPNILGTGADSATLVSSHTDTLSNLPSGNIYHYLAKSFGSGVGASAFGTFTTVPPDPIPPVVGITAPAPPYPVYTNVSPYAVQGTASDNVVVKTVSLTNNGANQTVNGTSPTWSSSVPLQPGLNTLVAVSNDGYNDSAPATASLFYDNVPPAVTITSPANNAVVNTSAITVSGSATESATSLVSMNIVVNGGPPQSIPVPNGATSFNWSSGATLVAGPNTIKVSATDAAGNTGSAQITVTYTVPSFTVTVAPASQNSTIGASPTYTVTVNSQNGFNSPVNLSVTSAPNGVSGSLNPAQVTPPANGSATATMTMTTAGASAVTYTLTVTATDPATGTTKTATATLTLAGFTVTAVPLSQTIIAGTSTSYQINVTPSATYTTGNATFGLSGLPGNTTGVFAPTSLSLTGGTTVSTILTVATQTNTPTGNFNLAVTVTDGTITQPLTLTLTVQAAPDFTFALQPSQQTITAGGSPLNFNGTLTPVNNFTGQVAVQVSSIVQATPNIHFMVGATDITTAPATISLATGQATFVANASADSQISCPLPGPCTYLVTLTASAGTMSHSQPVNLVVYPDITGPVVTNIVATPSVTDVTVTWTTSEPATTGIEVFKDQALTQSLGPQTLTGYTTNHLIVYGGLVAQTTYYFAVTSTDHAFVANTTLVTKKSDGSPLTFTTTKAPDNVPPTIALTSPLDTLPPAQLIGVVPVNGLAQDDIAMANVLLTILDPNGQSVVKDLLLPCTSTSDPTQCPFNYSWNSAGGAQLNGVYQVQVQAVAANGPALFSPWLTHQVNIQNDYTAPNVLCLPDQPPGFCGPEPVSSSFSCADYVSGNTCQITIHWLTDDQSTSEVNYCYVGEPGNGTGTCTPGVNYLHTTEYDDQDPTNPNPNYTDHHVTLKNLAPNQLYHYQIHSCNISSLCTN